MHEDHSHTHDHEVTHGEHAHCHAHSHEGQTAHTPEETAALLTYMIDHNKHHGEDLHEIYHSLVAAGKSEAAQHVHEAMHQYEHGNNELSEALKLIGG